MTMEILKNCILCPRACGADRTNSETGYCKAPGRVKIAKAFLHQWEEPCISGRRGSGAIFFSHCNAHCIFCQNYKISQEHIGREISDERLAEIFLRHQSHGAHNINLVSPTPYVPHILQAVRTARTNGLLIPVVYNTNAYDKTETIRLLQGTVNIYLPDMKYFDDQYAVKYSKAPRYFQYASQAIEEMIRQVGSPVLDGEGIMQKGVIIRHLVIPSLTEDSKNILSYIARNWGNTVYVSLMSQYTPMYNASLYPETLEGVKREDFERLVDYADALGLENVYTQGESSASEEYVPLFDLQGV